MPLKLEGMISRREVRHTRGIRLDADRIHNHSVSIPTNRQDYLHPAKGNRSRRSSGRDRLRLVRRSLRSR